MFFFAYNILSLLLLIPVFLFNIYRSVRLEWPLATAQRFGFVPQSLLAKIAGRPVILLHAVSVGEAVAARPLLKALRNRYPNHAIVVTNTTETGKSTAAGFSEVDLCLYFPFDFCLRCVPCYALSSRASSSSWKPKSGPTFLVKPP